jgi:hypothetical protein
VTHRYTIMVGGTIIAGRDRRDASAIAWAMDTVIADGFLAQLKPSEAPGKRSGAAPGTGQTRPLGTVCQYVLLKTILPRCQSWLGFGGRGGCS